MQNQDSKPSNPIPRRDIPEGWASNGRCPACGAAGLKVTHLPDMADYMSCAKCEISFEVENGGRYVRLKYVPDALEFVDGILHNRWVEASKLAGIIAKHRPAAPQTKTTGQPPVLLSEDDVWNRALRMYRLGNKPKMIQLMLVQSGQTQEQADVIFERLKKVADEDARLQNRKFWTVAGISLMVLACISGVWLVSSGRMSVMLGLVTATPIPTQALNQPSAIGMLVKLIPGEAKPDLMNLPKTTVEKNKGPGRAACPATSETASKLFGGDPALWRRDMNQFPSWQMINAGDSITVRVPNGMTAGYVDNETFQVQSVHGPATIHNVNFLVITCD
jgi:hypothetical protein